MGAVVEHVRGELRSPICKVASSMVHAANSRKTNWRHWQSWPARRTSKLIQVNIGVPGVYDTAISYIRG